MKQAKKTALVCGAGGFIGSHMVKRLKSEGYWVRGIDLEFPEFSQSEADEFFLGDLTHFNTCERNVVQNYQQPFVKPDFFDEVYQFAADMGGAGYVFTGQNDANIIHNSLQINLNIAFLLKDTKSKIFYSSSACMYPQGLQYDSEPGSNGHGLNERDAYPADPDSEYGWEKLMSERLYLAFARNYGLNVRIARFHNIYGPEGTYQGGREKAPAAICRKVIEAKESIDVWGDGYQMRSFLFIDDCIDAVRLLMQSDYNLPINIGSEEMITINELAKTVISLSGKKITVNHVDGPEGVRGRNSDNTLIKKELKWEPKYNFLKGIGLTYKWIKSRA